MITFSISLILLFLGYFIYGKITEKIFGIDPNRTTPAFRKKDNVDYVPMNARKAFLIQFLDIAGLGPVFGAILGAVYGPIAFIWIVIGGIFGGAVHDYFSGMMSVRQEGKSISEVIGHWLGIPAKQFMRIFTVFLMILVGASFMLGPANILAKMIGNIHIANITIEGKQLLWCWVIIILAYYFIATLVPIDKIIGKIYPIFGIALLFMAVGIGIMLYIHGSNVPELSFKNFYLNMKSNKAEYPIFPLIFITISCGAISGFHSTQSPLMARTIKNEKTGRQVFFGAMIAESIVALIWAAAAMTFFGGIEQLNTYIDAQNGNPANLVSLISKTWLGTIGGILAILGVVAAPITTGDTALRSARLIIADFTKLKQNSLKNRLIITIPLFATTFSLTLIKFDALWRLMFWFNQTLAAIVLWGITVYLAKKHKFFWITIFPAIFMTAVVATYIFIAKETLDLQKNISYTIGGTITIATTIYFFINYFKKYRKSKPATD